MSGVEEFNMQDFYPCRVAKGKTVLQFLIENNTVLQKRKLKIADDNAKSPMVDTRNKKNFIALWRMVHWYHH